METNSNAVTHASDRRDKNPKFKTFWSFGDLNPSASLGTGFDIVSDFDTPVRSVCIHIRVSDLYEL